MNEEIKLLTVSNLSLMKEVLEDDNMIFDLEKLKDYLSYKQNKGLLPNYQDKGLGTKLLSYIKDYATNNKYSEMFVITDKGNPRACHLYEKLGGKNDFENEIVYVYDFEKLG